MESDENFPLFPFFLMTNFHFPSTVLKEEDFAPVETFIFKEYYRLAFLELMDKVIKIKYIITQY